MARVPVYGTTDAGRNFYLRVVDTAKKADLNRSQVISALVAAAARCLNEEGQ